MSMTIEGRTVGSKRYVYVYHGDKRQMEGAIDATTFTYGGSYVAAGARTGGSNADHYCNAIFLEYI
jgi:hypothetical protein